ncbi:hypothetical protein [Morganella morganii IS15]|nr:hypothetical protein [Morganella morganii IS15]
MPPADPLPYKKPVSAALHLISSFIPFSPGFYLTTLLSVYSTGVLL